MIILKRATRSILLNTKFAASQDQRFLRFIDFEAKYLTQIPFIFKPIQPLVESIKNIILQFNQSAGLPWWSVLFLGSFSIRLLIFPLILVQINRISKLGPVAPVFVHIKDVWKSSQFSFWKKCSLGLKIYRDICKQQGFRLRKIFVYNLVYYPALIMMIYSIRMLIGDPTLSGATFLHIKDFTDIDPYFILPTLTVGLYYWNFQRFITPQNRYTLISRIRVGCQIFLIIWFPFLCCWPSGLVIYMCSNALISCLQTTLMKSPWFISKISQKITFYNYTLTTVQYDKGTSQTIISAIKSGQQKTQNKAIKQEQLLKQTNAMLQKLNKQNKQQDLHQEQQIDQQQNKEQDKKNKQQDISNDINKQDKK